MEFCKIVSTRFKMCEIYTGDECSQCPLVLKHVVPEGNQHYCAVYILRNPKLAEEIISSWELSQANKS